MKKLLFLGIILFMFPSIINASTKKHVVIEIKSKGNTIESIIKFKIKKDGAYINDTIYETNNSGIYEDDIALENGKYELEIVEIPTNILAYNTNFTVSSDNVIHKADFAEQKGVINIERRGVFIVDNTEVYIDDIKDVEYEIYALENIDSHTGTKYKKDELISTIKTYHGYASIVLPMGKYYVIEKNSKNYLNYEKINEVTIDMLHIYPRIMISTLHNPLKITSNVDYKLCSKDDILIDNKVVVSKDTCFDNKSLYNYIPYGTYLFITNNDNKEINFNADNNIFDFNVELTENKKEEPDDIIKNDKIEAPNEIVQNKEDSLIDSSMETIKKDIEDASIIDTKKEITTDESDIKSISLEDKRMPITSSRSNKYSLLISGIIFIVLGIMKK